MHPSQAAGSCSHPRPACTAPAPAPGQGKPAALTSTTPSRASSRGGTSGCICAQDLRLHMHQSMQLMSLSSPRPRCQGPCVAQCPVTEACPANHAAWARKSPRTPLTRLAPHGRPSRAGGGRLQDCWQRWPSWRAWLGAAPRTWWLAWSRMCGAWLCRLTVCLGLQTRLCR